MNQVRIVSDGTAAGTQVFVDGKPLEKVISIDIDRIECGSIVSATIKVLSVDLDVVADADIPGPTP